VSLRPEGLFFQADGKDGGGSSESSSNRSDKSVVERMDYVVKHAGLGAVAAVIRIAREQLRPSSNK
jgi:hypothetical protein